MGTNDIIDYIKKNGGTISAKEYNKLLKAKDSTIKKDKTLKSANAKIPKSSSGTKTIKPNSKYDFNFALEVEKINNTAYRFVLKGRHYSTNDVNRWLSFGKRNAYKTAIKKAFQDYFLVNKKEKPTECFEKAVMYSISYNPYSRDDDGNRITLKPFRDMLTEYGFIVDDKRACFFEYPNFEQKQKDYKIEVNLIKTDNLPTLNDFLENKLHIK